MACVRIRVHGELAWLCGDFSNDERKPCAECGVMPSKLCDYPIGNERTCDRLLCEDCAVKIQGDIDYCPSHATEWGKVYHLQFKEKDGSGI